MKKSVLVCFIVMITVATTSVAMAKPKSQPPGPPAIVVSGAVINACYQKINGQLRIVSDPGQCRPSELSISWNIVGPQGPTGVVATETFGGSVGPIANSSSQWVFAGPTASATTTASQRITGAAQAPLGTTSVGVASFGYDLCYRKAGTSDALINFTGATHSIGDISDTAGSISFAATSSVVPGAGTWEVGYCIMNSGPLDLNNNDSVNGWVMVTEQ